MLSISSEKQSELNKLLDELLVEARKNYTNSEELIFVEKQIELNAKVAKGKPASEFSLKNEARKSFSLSDLKGKYVLIDFWSTWCQPCIREIPFSKELKAEFGDNVTFVYVCIASKEDKWKEMINEKPLKGVQLFVEGKEEKQMTDDYQVSFFPTYILLDREGKIINVNSGL